MVGHENERNVLQDMYRRMMTTWKTIVCGRIEYFEVNTGFHLGLH